MNYKCPICGNKEYIESPLINRGEYIDIQDTNKLSIQNSYQRQSYFQPRGLITYNIDVHGDASCTESFENHCTTRICTTCGFVSIHAKELADEIINSINSLKTQQNYLIEQKNKLVRTIEELEKEQKNIPQKLSETKKELQDENITVKHQKEMKEQVEYLKKRTTDINKQIYNAKNQITEIDEKIIILHKQLQYVNKYKVSK